ncbi:DinB family protein [Streptacidiphilus cavernicola]|uniref:DinB family protein n=1 Tax=Streptacidiphilus cavernicola TaxID=3342716 RepID=A0ABV6VZ55_9ACTN
MPPLTADERTNLEAWLDFYRATLALKCAGLTEEQLRSASVQPSPLTLLGLVRHLAEVERNWFRRVLAGEDAPPRFATAASGRDSGGFDLSDVPADADADAPFAAALAAWREETVRARANCAARELEATVPFPGGGEVTLRWIYTHMIAEYARHSGHADLIRERIDGATGV